MSHRGYELGARSYESGARSQELGVNIYELGSLVSKEIGIRGAWSQGQVVRS